jgi:hypothetical protein
VVKLQGFCSGVIKKINEIGKLLAEVIEEAVHQSEAESVRIGDGEMALRETLQAVGGSALKQFLENADGEQEADRVCLWRKMEERGGMGMKKRAR